MFESLECLGKLLKSVSVSRLADESPLAPTSPATLPET